MALGVLAERISSQTWEDLVRQRITGPLGMANTVFTYEEMFKKPDYATSYLGLGGQMLAQPFDSNVDAMGPAGSIKTSATDMAAWLQLQLGRGKFAGKTIISEAQWQNTHTPQVVVPGELKYEEYSYSHYGLGWRIDDYRDRLRVYHNGSIEGFRTQVTLFPRQNFGIAIMTNTSSADYYFVNTASNYIADQLLGLVPVDWHARLKLEQADTQQKTAQALAAPDTLRVANTQPAHPLVAYAGVYVHPAYGQMRVQVFENRLLVSYRRHEINLSHYHYETFEALPHPRFNKYQFHFDTNAQGRVATLAVPLEPALGKPIVFVRQLP
jgi:CubicO group peptidase (beta-lactamase class C family)